MSDFDEMERLARAADPGPWEVGFECKIAFVLGPSSNPSIPSPDLVATTRYSDRFIPNDNANMAHIAASDPTAVLALLAAYRRERDHVARLRELVQHMLDADQGNAFPFWCSQANELVQRIDEETRS